jgi:hypothetical protein
MNKLVKFDVEDGATVLIEVEEMKFEGVEPVSKPIDELAAQASQSLGKALDGLTPMIRTLKNRLNALTDPADEVEVKFSVKLTAEVGAIITHLGGEATYEITLKWGNK